MLMTTALSSGGTHLIWNFASLSGWAHQLQDKPRDYASNDFLQVPQILNSFEFPWHSLYLPIFQSSNLPFIHDTLSISGLITSCFLPLPFSFTGRYPFEFPYFFYLNIRGRADSLILQSFNPPILQLPLFRFPISLQGKSLCWRPQH